MAQNLGILGRRVSILLRISMILGCISIVYGFHLVVDTQFNFVDERTDIIVAPLYQPLVGYPHATGLGVTLTTSDMFTVNNIIHGTVDVFVIDPQNINQTFVWVMNHENAGKLETNDQKIINDIITTERQDRQGTFGNHVVTLNDKFSIESNFVWTAYTEDRMDVLVYLQTKDGSWEYLAAQDIPTIQPVNVMTELKNSKVVEGLTWIIVGAVPVGLFFEFFIHSRLEDHFYRLEKSDRDFGLNLI